MLSWLRLRPGTLRRTGRSCWSDACREAHHDVCLGYRFAGVTDGRVRFRECTCPCHAASHREPLGAALPFRAAAGPPGAPPDVLAALVAPEAPWHRIPAGPFPALLPRVPR